MPHCSVFFAFSVVSALAWPLPHWWSLERSFLYGKQGIRGWGLIFLAMPGCRTGFCGSSRQRWSSGLADAGSIAGLAAGISSSCVFIRGVRVFFIRPVTGFSPSIAILEGEFEEEYAPGGLRLESIGSPKLVSPTPESVGREAREISSPPGFIVDAEGLPHPKFPAAGLSRSAFLFSGAFLGLPDHGKRLDKSGMITLV